MNPKPNREDCCEVLASNCGNIKVVITDVIRKLSWEFSGCDVKAPQKQVQNR